MQLEVSKQRTEKTNLQVKLSELERRLKNHTDADWKRMEQEHKVSLSLKL